MRALLLALVLLAGPALAEENLSSGLSQDYLQINSTFTGTELTVFGAVENPPEDGVGDIVVVVRGPNTLMTVRRKDRLAGLWINDARARIWMPSYYFITAAKPVEKIADRATLGRYELGVTHLASQIQAVDGNPAPFVAALIRAKERTGLYVQREQGIEMQSATLFRTHVPIPASVPRGSYNVEVYVFRDGAVIAAQSTPFYVDQAGFERRLYEFAHAWPWSYGVLTVLLAAALGWVATLFFKRTS